MIGTRWLIRLGVLALGLWASKSLAQFAEEAVGDQKQITKDYNQNNFIQARLKDTPKWKEDLDLAAKVFAWRCTWPDYVNDPKKLEDSLDDFEKLYNKWILLKTSARIEPPDPEAKAFFHEKLIEHLDKVLKREFTKNRVSTIHAAQLLAIVAKSKDDKFSIFLTRLINDDKQSDPVQLFAVRALKEFFPSVLPVELQGKIDRGEDLEEEEKNQVETLTRLEIDRVETLTKFIERNWPKTENPQERDAFCYLRREAIQTLARAQIPAVRIKKIRGVIEVEGQVAVTLTRVLAAKGFDPRRL